VVEKKLFAMLQQQLEIWGQSSEPKCGYKIFNIYFLHENIGGVLLAFWLQIWIP